MASDKPVVINGLTRVLSHLGYMYSPAWGRPWSRSISEGPPPTPVWLWADLTEWAFRVLYPWSSNLRSGACLKNNWGNLPEGTFWTPWNGSSLQETRDFVSFMVAFPLPSTQDTLKVTEFTRDRILGKNQDVAGSRLSSHTGFPNPSPGERWDSGDSELMLTAALPAHPIPGNCPQEQLQPLPTGGPQDAPQNPKTFGISANRVSTAAT